jgi:hypothetical protein
MYDCMNRTAGNKARILASAGVSVIWL